jgi:hypothetical protein
MCSPDPQVLAMSAFRVEKTRTLPGSRGRDVCMGFVLKTASVSIDADAALEIASSAGMYASSVEIHQIIQAPSLRRLSWRPGGWRPSMRALPTDCWPRPWTTS